MEETNENNAILESHSQINISEALAEELKSSDVQINPISENDLNNMKLQELPEDIIKGLMPWARQIPNLLPQLAADNTYRRAVELVLPPNWNSSMRFINAPKLGADVHYQELTQGGNRFKSKAGFRENRK